MSFLINALFTFWAIGVTDTTAHSDSSRVEQTNTTLSVVSNALDMYKLDSLYYPSTAQGLNVLSTPPANAKNYPTDGYIKGGYPTDAWNNKLQYIAIGTSRQDYDLYSLGADGQKGGEGQNADIYYK